MAKRVLLWHPDSPGSRIWVRPCLLRRIGIVRSEFATLGEAVRMYREYREYRESCEAPPA